MRAAGGGGGGGKGGGGGQWGVVGTDWWVGPVVDDLVGGAVQRVVDDGQQGLGVGEA